MRIIQLLFLLLPFTLLCQKKYAPLNTQWNYEGHDLECQGYHINYIVEKEQIIQGNDCSVILAYTSSDLNENFQKSQDSLIVWEDDNKVYFLEDTTFYLLFDFDNEIGDTITYYEPSNKSVFTTNPVNNLTQSPDKYQIVITNIELLNIDNVELRKYDTEIIYPENVLCTWPSSIIENIGSNSHSLAGEHVCYVADGCFGGLQCYNNEILDYKTSEIFETPNPSCDILDSVNENNFESRIELFPNPATNEIHIKSDNDIEFIEIFSINGRSICLDERTDNIQIEHLDSGIYLVKVKLNKSVEILKFIKK